MEDSKGCDAVGAIGCVIAGRGLPLALTRWPAASCFQIGSMDYAAPLSAPVSAAGAADTFAATAEPSSAALTLRAEEPWWGGYHWLVPAPESQFLGLAAGFQNLFAPLRSQPAPE